MGITVEQESQLGEKWLTGDPLRKKRLNWGDVK
jgi:hypothetical protein